MNWLTLWRNREIAYELFRWFMRIVKQASEVAEVARRLSESVEKGDLDDLVKKAQSVATRRKDYVENG